MGRDRVSLIHGDSLRVMCGLQADSVDLVMTSPPYADARAHTYGGQKPDDYVAWFLPFALEMRRVIRPTGSIVINIKEKSVDGQRHRYVLDLINALVDDADLRWVEEYIWHKRNSMPGKWHYRFRDAWERLLHFTKAPKFKMNQDAVMRPARWVEDRRLTERDFRRVDHKTGSKFGVVRANWVGRDMSYPSNVLHETAEQANKGHSAVYPESLPNFFIRLFTDEDDLVLDPFVGSGTTCKVAQDLGRRSIGVDQDPAAIEVARRRVKINQERLAL